MAIICKLMYGYLYGYVCIVMYGCMYDWFCGPFRCVISK